MRNGVEISLKKAKKHKNRIPKKQLNSERTTEYLKEKRRNKTETEHFSK